VVSIQNGFYASDYGWEGNATMTLTILAVTHGVVAVGSFLIGMLRRKVIDKQTELEGVEAHWHDVVRGLTHAELIERMTGKRP
jgi:hypothetical protein